MVARLSLRTNFRLLDGPANDMGCTPHTPRPVTNLGFELRITSTERLKLMTEHNAIVATYKSHAEAESAVKELQQSGFDMKKLSIVGRDYQTDEHVVGYYNAGDRVKYWGTLGAFWGGIWGLLFGSAFFLIPGVGPILAAGPLVGWIIAALENAVIVGGVSALGAGLYSQGIPKDSVLKYETGIKTGKFVLIAHGTAQEATRAREVIDRTNPDALEGYTFSRNGEELLAA